MTFSFLRHGSKRPTHKRTFFVPSAVGLPLTTLLFHFKPLLYHCFNILTIKGPPLSKTKNLKKWPYFTFWNLSEFSLLYFITVDFASLFSLYVYLAYCCLIFCLRTFFLITWRNVILYFTFKPARNVGSTGLARGVGPGRSFVGRRSFLTKLPKLG